MSAGTGARATSGVIDSVKPKLYYAWIGVRVHTYLCVRRVKPCSMAHTLHQFLENPYKLQCVASIR
ncbi:MAG: hypothetical protein ACP5G6_05370 [Conexivisphaera sp.]